MAAFRRFRFWFAIVFSVSLVAAAGCGGSSEPTATNATVTPTARAINSSTASGNNATATATGSSTGGFGDLFAGACDSIGLVANLPGVDVNGASGEPPSTAARDATDYFTPIISNALGNATPECYIEEIDQGSYSLFVGYSLNSVAPSDSEERLRAEFVSRSFAEDDIEFFSANFGGTSFSTVTVTNVPALNQDGSSEAVLSISGSTVVLTVNYDDSGTGSSNDSTPTPSASGSQPTPTSVSPTVSASGITAEVDALLKPALEDALGVILNLTSEFSITDSGTSSVVLAYQPLSIISANIEDALSSVITGMGGEVSVSMSGDGSTLVYFEGIKLGERIGSGGITYDGETVGATISIE